MEWKNYPQDRHKLVCDENYLVSFINGEGKYSGPYRAYWIEEDQLFYHLDSDFAIALKVDIFLEMPKLPETAKERFDY